MSVRRPDPTKQFLLGDSLQDLFDAAGIQFGRRGAPSPGETVDLICPKCGGGTTRKTNFRVTIDRDGKGVVWVCHRQESCGYTGNGRVESAATQHDAHPVPKRRDPVVKPKPHPAAEQNRGQAFYDWFAGRGISRATVDWLGIYGVTERWPDVGEDGKVALDQAGEAVWVDKPTIVFPYFWEGDLVSRKFRSIDKQFRQDKNTLRALFNADAITSQDEVIFCEGEMDVAAMVEAGFRQVVSLPDGAPQKLREADDPQRQGDGKFEALETAGALLEGVKRVVIAGDADVPGGYLAEELARRLGKTRCWRVTWPEGCKDANDVLLKHGAEVVRQCVAAAEPWPVTGLFNLRPGMLREFLSSGQQPRGLDSGIAALDEIVRLPAGGGWLTVVTGIPSHGKSAFLRGWLAYIAYRHNIGIVWCSPEDNRPETLALDIAQIIMGQPVKEAGTYMPDRVLADAERWINERVTFIVADDPKHDLTPKWLLERAEDAKRRHKRDLLVLDPWNEAEHLMERGESETQYTGRQLRYIKAWGRREGMGVLIAAHPLKQQKDPKTGKYPIVEGYDINGSAMWMNRADVGITIYRERDNEVKVLCWKARFPAFGQRQSVVDLKRDWRTGRLSSIGAQSSNDVRFNDYSGRGSDAPF